MEHDAEAVLLTGLYGSGKSSVVAEMAELLEQRDPTSGRARDLEVARRDAAAGEREGIEDLAVDNDRPLGQVAAEIVAWLGWA